MWEVWNQAQARGWDTLNLSPTREARRTEIQRGSPEYECFDSISHMHQNPKPQHWHHSCMRLSSGFPRCTYLSHIIIFSLRTLEFSQVHWRELSIGSKKKEKKKNQAKIVDLSPARQAEIRESQPGYLHSDWSTPCQQSRDMWGLVLQRVWESFGIWQVKIFCEACFDNYCHYGCWAQETAIRNAQLCDRYCPTCLFHCWLIWP